MSEKELATETKVFSIRCLAYPGENEGQQGYYAVCIDLNLVTWRPTPQAAMQSLTDAVHGYLETVMDLQKQGVDWKTMVPRPAAFWPYKFMYHASALRRALPRLSRRRDFIFDEPVDMPAMAAAA